MDKISSEALARRASVDARADAEELAFAFRWLWFGWREVVVEGAFGGVVEFF
jgi:hypothetical protein